MNITDICLVNKSTGLEVQVRVDGRWFTAIQEPRSYNPDGTPAITSHHVSSSGIKAVIKEAGGVGDGN